MNVDGTNTTFLQYYSFYECTGAIVKFNNSITHIFRKVIGNYCLISKRIWIILVQENIAIRKDNILTHFSVVAKQEHEWELTDDTAREHVGHFKNFNMYIFIGNYITRII